MSTQRLILKRALSAINDLHSDTSVPLSQTLEELEIIMDEVNVLISLLHEDIEREEQG